MIPKYFIDAMPGCVEWNKLMLRPLKGWTPEKQAEAFEIDAQKLQNVLSGFRKIPLASQRDFVLLISCIRDLMRNSDYASDTAVPRAGKLKDKYGKIAATTKKLLNQLNIAQEIEAGKETPTICLEILYRNRDSKRQFTNLPEKPAAMQCRHSLASVVA